MRIKHCILACIVLFILAPYNTKAQTVFENTEAPVIGYLQRMAQKGKIKFNDLILPVSRTEIQNALDSLLTKQFTLTSIEQKELAYYLEVYPPQYFTGSIKKYKGNKWTSISISDKNEKGNGKGIDKGNFEMHIEPLLSAQRIQGSGDKSIAVNQVSNGAQLWGQSKHWGFQFYYRDWTETGTGLQNLDSMTSFSNQTEKILVGVPTASSHNYSEVRANLSYSWDKGNISFGKLPLSWGYGEAAKMVLSTKAPSYPSLRFNYQPLSWLSFNYAHAWLNSNIVDPTKSYSTNSDGVSGNQRIVYIPKFMALHSVQIEAMKGLQIALGESIIYSDKIDPGFLMPLNIYKVYDNNRSNYSINAGSNGQIFLQINSRNQIKNTHLYGSLFVDEIRISAALNAKKARNQIGYTMGGSITDILLPYLTIGMEYGKINPFVYQNLLPAQSYTNYNSVLGDWMGNNADRITVFAKYQAIPKLQLYARYQSIRKGIAGSIHDQYLAEPQPKFLEDGHTNYSNLLLQANYEWLHNLYLIGKWESTEKNNLVQLGISLGLR